MSIKLKHLLSGNELDAASIQQLLALAKALKADRQLKANALERQSVALLFEKPSLRTRFSFSVAVYELGGQAIDSVADTRKKETPEDLIRVLQGYCQAVMIRTYDESIIERMMAVSQIPIINGLTDLFHPCQTLADLLTLQEHFNTLDGLHICYIGDGNNILHSLLLMAPKLGIHVHYCCPKGHTPAPTVLNMVEQNGLSHLIKAYEQPTAAVANCKAVYTDVWTSMGFASQDESIFKAYQVNEGLMQAAFKDALFMHCMPMERGKEVSESLPDAPCSVIFEQSENRLHVQKALLINLLT